MSEIVNCPQCERKLKVPDTLIGKSVKCPTCGATFTAEVGGQPAAPPPLPREEEPRYEEQEEAPVRRSGSGRRRARDDDDEEDYDDEDDRPRRRGGSRRRRRGEYLAPHRGSLIMVLGILSFFVAGPILGPIAWIMGNNDLEEMRAGRMDPEGEGQTNAGRICGMISTILSIASVVFICFCCILGSLGNNM